MNIIASWIIRIRKFLPKIDENQSNQILLFIIILVKIMDWQSERKNIK